MFLDLNDTCGLVTTSLTVLIALGFLFLQIQQKQWVGVNTFIVVFGILIICCKFGVCHCIEDIRICLLLAVLVANVVALPQRLSTTSSEEFETFSNLETAVKETNPAAAEAEAETTSLNTDTNPTSSSQQSTAEPAAIESKTSNSNDDNDDTEPNYVDTFSTFMETYKSLSPGQIETMTSDTKDLIATQKSLMETVKSLAPIITQGREMMDTFKDYFGPNSDKDLMKAFKGTSDKKQST